MKRVHLFKPTLIALVFLSSVGLTQPGMAANGLAKPAEMTAKADRTSWQSLNLTTPQKMQLAGILWDVAAAREDFRSETDDVIAFAQSELQRSDADLAAIIDRSEPLTDRRIANARDIRDRLIDFYATQLTSDQQATARQILLQKLDHLNQLRDAGDNLRSLLEGL